MNLQRKIIHIDMDAFYASVEQRDNPQYRGKPLVVGGSPDKRGAIAAASYEARKFGIHSTMPSRTAIQRCPHLIFAPPRFEVYWEISEQIRSIFESYTDLVEPLALDEAYLDVTANKKGVHSATALAQEVNQRMERNETRGRTITLKVKFADYRQITRSRTMLETVLGQDQILAIAIELLASVEFEAQAVRLLGITFSNLDTEMDEPSYQQMELDLQMTARLMSLDATMDWS
jgi:nucleotidyltransferase/DNA polymerase involved in DNA repair